MLVAVAGGAGGMIQPRYPVPRHVVTAEQAGHYLHLPPPLSSEPEWWTTCIIVRACKPALVPTVSHIQPIRANVRCPLSSIHKDGTKSLLLTTYSAVTAI